MRVKIAYTVDLGEVEDEVAEIMARATNDLDDAYQELINAQASLDTQTGEIENHLKTINFARTKLGKADQILDDCYLILQGLEQTRKQLEEKENEIQDG
jgi:endonuclease III